MKREGTSPVALDAAHIERWKAAILDLTAQAAYTIEPDWAVPGAYEDFRQRWTSTHGQHFLDEVVKSLSDERTVAEAWIDGDRLVGFLWVTFSDVARYSATVADVRQIALAFTHRERGLGHEMFDHAAQLALERGAHVLRGEIRADNLPARRAIEASGARPARVVYERVLRHPITEEEA